MFAMYCIVCIEAVSSMYIQKLPEGENLNPERISYKIVRDTQLLFAYNINIEEWDIENISHLVPNSVL